MQNFILKSNYQSNFYIYQAGHEKCDCYHSYGPVVRDFNIFHFVVNGAGTLEVDNKVFEIKKGDVFLVPSGKLVSYRADKNNPYEYYWIGFSGVLEKDFMDLVNLGNGNYIIDVNDDYNEILKLLEGIKKITNEKSIRDNLYAKSIFYSFLSKLTPKDATYKVIDEKEETLSKIVAYIDQNYATTSIIEIANLFHVHRSTIYRLFVANYKMSPNTYLLKYRLERALFLLKNTESSIKKIAISTGFEDSESFCKAFKSKFNKTPSQARKLK